MGDSIKILKNSYKNIDSVDINTYQKIRLENNLNNITEYNIRDVIDVTRVFELEREETEVYQIYGEIEYLSLFDGLDKNYKNISDFLNPENINNIGGRRLTDTFDFYLVRPFNIGDVVDVNIIRSFEVVATQNDIDIFPIGFSKNIFYNQRYSFIINKDIDISNYVDSLGIPHDELYLYVVYKPLNTGESVKCVNFTGSYPNIQYTTHNIGDVIQYGDFVRFNKNEFKLEILYNQTYFINTNMDDFNNKPATVEWKYNPFIPLKLRYFSEDVQKINNDTPMYEQKISIPKYAIDVGGGNFIWRDILPQGFIDPITNIGVDYPFVNKKRYLFKNIKLSITPNVGHAKTKQIFENIVFGVPSVSNTTPNNIDNIGKPC